MVSRIVKLAAVCATAAAVLTTAVCGSVNFYTCVGGASGMTVQPSPYKTGGVQRGAASEVMDVALSAKANPSGTGTCCQAYTAANMKSADSTGSTNWSEPSANFTGLASQTELNSAHFPNATTDPTPDYLVSIAVLAIIYNQDVSSTPLNVTTEMERMISGGMVDNWDCFFSGNNIHESLLDFYREPLSGTCQTYKNLCT